MDTIDTIVESTPDTHTVVATYVLAPLAVYGAWKLTGAVYGKIRARRASKKTLTVVE